MAKTKLSFEQALERIEEIVSEIEGGSVPLEESIDKYAEGTKLIERCRTILQGAEKKIQLLTQGQDQKLETAGLLPEDEPQENE